jgi:hypothetical protein
MLLMNSVEIYREGDVRAQTYAKQNMFLRNSISANRIEHELSKFELGLISILWIYINKFSHKYG